MAALGEELSNERKDRKREEHRMELDLWKQRESLNAQMVTRIQLAKATFLDVTSEMLDSTVHRTMRENQERADELALMTARMHGLVRDNEQLLTERAAMRRELSLQREQEAAEVRRSLARRRLAQTATGQHEALAQELELAQHELSLANQRTALQETTIRKLHAQLKAAQRRVNVLSARTAEQQKLIDSRLSPTSATETEMPPYPDWSLILPGVQPPPREEPHPEPHVVAAARQAG